MKNTCFFCSKNITDKKTQEHIIPNGLLAKLGIKEETITGVGDIQYSRLKVPAHQKCNNEFGSIYENEIIELLDNPDELYETLKSEENGILIKYGPNNSTTMIISTWLSKIYYGLFYNDFLKTNDETWKNAAKDIIDCDNFRMIQKSYKANHGFCLPSSLFVFKSVNSDFDLRTYIYPQCILIKIRSLIFILSIGDGYLPKNYLNGEILKKLREFLSNEETINSKFPVHLFAFAEIISLRKCIAKSPIFVYSENEIINMSLSTGVSNPEEYYRINEEELELERNEVLLCLGVTIK